jgi:hypothetical protein
MQSVCAPGGIELKRLIALCLLAVPLAADAFPVLIGARLSTPQIASVSITYRPKTLWFLQVEPGVGGGKAALGLGGSWSYHFGMGVKCSLLHTWGKTLGGVETGQTYAGGEGVLMISGVNLTFGLYSHIDGDAPDKDMLVSVGVGVGF